MITLRHLVISTVLYGTFAVFLWLIYAWVEFGFLSASDLFPVWIYGLVWVAAFIVLICWPTLRLAVSSDHRKAHIVTGAATGVFAVASFFAIFTKYPINLEYMVYRSWLYYVIFTIIGGLYGLSYHKQYKA